MSKPETTHVLDKETSSASNGSQEVFEQKPTFGQKAKAIFKKFWWAFLIVLCVGVVVVTVPLVLVGFPRIIQGKMDAATVVVDGIRITQPKPTSVYFEMNSTLHSGGGISAVIDPFNASLYLEDKEGHVPFAYIQIPKTSAEKVVLVNVSQVLNLYNVPAYTDFNSWYLLNESFRVTLDGDTLVHVKGLKATKVKFHKTVTLAGLNAFKGFEVTSFDISLTPDERGDNFKGFATIPDPAVLTVEIGNTTFNNFLNGTSIGHLFIDNLTLYPGNNNVSIRANVSQLPVLQAVTSPEYCPTGIVPLGVLGETVLGDGEHLPYYEAGFRENHQTITLDIGAALAKTLGKKPACSSN